MITDQQCPKKEIPRFIHFLISIINLVYEFHDNSIETERNLTQTYHADEMELEMDPTDMLTCKKL